MKAALFLSLLIVRFLSTVVSAGNETECVKCGCNMVAVGQGCECNQICNAKEPRICPKRPCLNTCDVCACLPGFCLPHENSKDCVEIEECN